MHLSKKKKTILAWTIPSAVLIVAAAVVTPVVIIQESKKYDRLNDARNYVPKNFSQFSDEQKDKLEINPEKYTFNYFVNVISRSEALMNNVFLFPSLEKDDKNNCWYDKDGTQYKILPGISYELINNDTNYRVHITIEKSYDGLSKTYTKTVIIKNNFASTEEEACKNFVPEVAKRLFNYVNEKDITIALNPSKIESITDLAGISSSDDLDLSTNVVSMQMMKNSTKGSYNLNGDAFTYLGNPIQLSIPVDQKYLWNSTDAYKFTDDGQFDKTSSAFVALKQEYTNGNLTFLPELSEEETNGLTEDEIIDAKIQKLIFNPDVWGYDLQTATVADANGNKITNKVPLGTNQAIAIKVSIDKDGQEQGSTYIVLWTNLFQASGSIVNSASSLPLKIQKGPNGILTYENLIKPSTVVGNKLDNETFWNTYIKTEQPPKNNLIYTIKKVEFAPDDKYFTKALITVEITHPELGNASKEYTYTAQEGFLSKAYIEMDEAIFNLMGSSLNFSKLTPSLAFKSGIDVNKLINGVLNESAINTNIDLTMPSGLSADKVQYKFKSALLNGNKIQVTYNLCSPNDPTKLWTMNGIVQDISAEIAFTTTKVSTNT